MPKTLADDFVELGHSKLVCGSVVRLAPVACDAGR